MRRARRAAALLLVAAGLALARCGGDGPVAPPAPPPPALPAPSNGKAIEPPLHPDAPKEVTFSQILILYKPTREIPNPRTRDDAYALAKSLIAQLKRGTRIEMLLKHSDDIDVATGKPFNDGSYSLAYDNLQASRTLMRVVFSLAVGEVAADPVEEERIGAYLVIRRDA